MNNDMRTDVINQMFDMAAELLVYRNIIRELIRTGKIDIANYPEVAKYI